MSIHSINTCENVLHILANWRNSQAIRPLDLAMVQALYDMAIEQSQSPKPISLLLAAIASRHIGDGHVCIDIQKLLQSPDSFIKAEKVHVHQHIPIAAVINGLDLQTSLNVLKDCPLVSQAPVSDTPIVLKGTRLYLARFFNYEQIIAQGINSRLSVLKKLQDPKSEHALMLKESLAVLFKGADVVKGKSQILACALAARSRFSVITGGPGTGKTTTVVKLLAAMQSIPSADDFYIGKKYRIALAAPTGKAAARLNYSISQSVNAIDFSSLPGAVSKDDIPTQVITLHSLLGGKFASRLFRYNKQNPLPVDVLVIDEASMVDVSLMAAVIMALRSDAKLILLGDKDQLASVDAGAVLGSLAQYADQDNYTQASANWLASITGLSVDNTNSQGSELAQNVAMLNHSFRFDENSGIGQLAKMVNSGQADFSLLTSFKQTKLRDALWLVKALSRSRDNQLIMDNAFIDHVIDGSAHLFYEQGKGRVIHNQEISPPKGYKAYLQVLTEGAATLGKDSSNAQWDALARKVLQNFDRFQVLSAMRKGPFGVDALNEQIEQALFPSQLRREQGAFYQGRPLLVTRNDYNLGLTNGDIGIVIMRWFKGPNGEYKCLPRVAFPSAKASGDIRWFSPSRLQAIETVFAMTVHKSQGSEFEHTCFVLPEQINPVVTRELVYTAITRAVSWISIVSPNEEILRKSIGNAISRESGLMV